MTMQTAGGGGPAPSGLADVIDTILDKGLVIDAYVRVSLVGIELVTVEARVVVASLSTYLDYSDALEELKAAASLAVTAQVKPVQQFHSRAAITVVRAPKI